MKNLIIITRANREYESFWQLEDTNNVDFIHTKLRETNLLVSIFRPIAHISLSDKSEAYVKKIEFELEKEQSIEEIGIIFHFLNGNTVANELKSHFSPKYKSMIAFCEWYSSNKTDFWNELKPDTELPYNKLKRAWKDNEGSKLNSFNSVWNYFLGDQKLEKLLAPFENVLPLDSEWKKHREEKKEDLWIKRTELRNYFNH